jgi:hypothetical protein
VLSVEVARAHSRDLHADVLRVFNEFRAVRVEVGIELGNDARAAAAVDVSPGGAFDYLEAADAHVFADGEYHVLKLGFNGNFGAVVGKSFKSFDIGRFVSDDGFKDALDEFLEGSVLGNEVGLGVDFDNGGNAVFGKNVDNAFGGYSVGLLAATESPFSRRYLIASSKLPSVSTSAFLHSIMPQPVFLRSSITSFAGILTAILISPYKL